MSSVHRQSFQEEPLGEILTAWLVRAKSKAEEILDWDSPLRLSLLWPIRSSFQIFS